MKNKLRNKKVYLLVIPLIVFLSIQFVHPESTYVGIEKEEIALPKDIAEILRTSCFDCHSSETELKWFDKIAPASWIVAEDIKDGRAALNFSEWNDIPTKVQNGKLYYSLNRILAGEMPLKSYALLHNANVSNADIKVLQDYVTSRTPRVVADSTQLNAAEIQSHLLSDAEVLTTADFVEPALNGIEYIPDYKNWKVISTTDRFDNGTMRIIYGNEVAVAAIKSKKTNPWPDGSIIAKVAWKEQGDSSGNINTGEFLQVEYMIKDADKYAETKGWGWARWRGNDLKPYGNDAFFAQECITCHVPVKNNDYMFTVPLNLNNLGTSK